MRLDSSACIRVRRFPYSQLINRLKDVELLLRDKAQQLGTPGSNTILAHIMHLMS